MRVELRYFKRNGTYYTEGSYVTQRDSMTGIWREVQVMRERGVLPGLTPVEPPMEGNTGGHMEYIVLISVPDHDDNHPHLVV